ncbi:HAD family hydrolase [Flavihumibacter profundi]|jgi:glucose-1-phosphatase|uniref:HAD family hydrolase n=1 Tax=Flavihumibacter profundi TaxID=2716883 RepID=UPI001CC82480|nr:HAD family phosphatase [Flavihumibacter profundi]MBZ5859121.1 HAD family phosphatase [Flavihumibacter profundi]
MIRNIIFDMGNVIIDIDIPQTYHAFAELANLSSKEVADFFQTKGYYNALEKGDIDDIRFRNSIRENFGSELTDDQIDTAWCKLLLDMPQERLDRIRELKSNYRIFLLSNTNAIHIREVSKRALSAGHDFLGLFEIPFLSYEMGLMKPDIEIFLKTLDISGLKAEESLFIDDNEANILAAKSMGLQTIRLDPIGSLLDKLVDY